MRQKEKNAEKCDKKGKKGGKKNGVFLLEGKGEISNHFGFHLYPLIASLVSLSFFIITEERVRLDHVFLAKHISPYHYHSSPIFTSAMQSLSLLLINLKSRSLKVQVYI